MNIEWKKAEGELPNGEVLAVSQHGSVLVGFLEMEENGSWTCACPVDGGRNEYLRNVRWYIPMAELLATVPKEQE